MNSVTVAVDLAKHVFEIAVANRAHRILQRRRLTRPQFERFFQEHEPCRVVLEACASAHFWARHLVGRGFEVILLPPHYVRPYVRRNKTDRTDCEALLEALRCAGIHPVSIRSEEQQAISERENRTSWQSGRTAAGKRPITRMRQQSAGAAIGPRCAKIHDGPERQGSTQEAGYTTAAEPLCWRAAHSFPLTDRRSPYTQSLGGSEVAL